MQELGGDTLTRDEVTGLAAFDNLDQISTVSALSIMPEPPAPPPRVFSSPPPRPMGARPSSVPVPASRNVTLPPAGMAAAPAAPTAARSFSRPPELPAASVRPRAQEAQILDADSDSDSDAAIAADGTYESWDESDDALTRVRRPMLPGALEGAKNAHATDLQMDWDDEELPTQMRGEGALPDVPDELATAGFEAVSTSFADGRPSPFPSAHTSAAAGYAAPGSFPPATALPGLATGSYPAAPVSQSGAPSPFARTTSTDLDTAWGQDLRGDKPLWLWVGGGSVAILALGLVARMFLSAPSPGVITLTTQPGDVSVTIDGKAIAATASPFSANDVTPNVTHELTVSKAGFVEQHTSFTVKPGETVALADIRLAAVPHDVGFAISSTPAGADILVDGRSVGQVTPARVTHVTAGMHKIELTHDGYRTFESQVNVPESSVLELPSAALIAASGKSASAASPSSATVAQPAEHHHHHHDHVAAAARSSAPAPIQPVAAARTRAPAPVKSAPVKRPVLARVAAPSAGKGLLRVNSRPWSQVFVDGKLIGNTPQMGIQLAAGNHTIKLVNKPMGLSKTVSVAVQSGQTVTKVMNLIE